MTTADGAAHSALGDWAVLFKSRITSFVGFSSWAGAMLAGAEFPRALEAALWISALSAASGAFNQVVEREHDARMARTRNRPIPSGRVSVRTAVVVAGVLTLGAVAALALRFEPLAALLGLGTLVSYVLVYTPLKRTTSLNTVVGAIPGAMPPLLGAVAVAGAPGTWGWVLFGTIFAWQFPHFLAIAWLYRDDYAAAGMRMLPSIPGTEGMAGRQAFYYCLALLPIPLMPMLRGEATLFYGVGALFVGLVYLVASLRFALEENPRTARTLLYVSLAHLPFVIGFALADRALFSI
ncbi:MAG: heme o synthase [Planctomycetota bacterium]